MDDHDRLADAVGPALLVVPETLTPAERLAFVLHDLVAVTGADGRITGIELVADPERLDRLDLAVLDG